MDGFGSGGGGGSKKKILRRNNSPRCHWILQKRSEFVEKMGAKRIRNMKVGRAAVMDAAAASEGNQKLLNQYEGAAGANPLNYILISVGGEVGADKNGGDKGSDNSGGVCGSVSIRPPHCVTATPVQGFVDCIFII